MEWCFDFKFYMVLISFLNSSMLPYDRLIKVRTSFQMVIRFIGSFNQVEGMLPRNFSIKCGELSRC